MAAFKGAWRSFRPRVPVGPKSGPRTFPLAQHRAAWSSVDKEVEKIYLTDIDQKKVEVVTLILDQEKQNLDQRKVSSYKKGHYIMVKGSIFK